VFASSNPPGQRPAEQGPPYPSNPLLAFYSPDAGESGRLLFSFAKEDSFHMAKRLFTGYTEFAYRTPEGCYFCSERIMATARFGGFFVRREQKM